MAVCKYAVLLNSWLQQHHNQTCTLKWCACIELRNRAITTCYSNPPNCPMPLEKKSICKFQLLKTILLLKEHCHCPSAPIHYKPFNVMILLDCTHCTSVCLVMVCLEDVVAFTLHDWSVLGGHTLYTPSKLDVQKKLAVHVVARKSNKIWRYGRAEQINRKCIENRYLLHLAHAG